MKIGGLCFGYGGLDLAVQSVIPSAELAWYAEFDKGASKIGAHHWPEVPNYGDMTKIDWAAVEPVDIITGGTPCQDLSHAGKRAGMTKGTRSNLWVAMREAIATIRPSLVIWENVGGAASAAADSEVEPCAGCVGDGSGVHLRALGRVLGDLSDLGYDCRWHGLRAADVGAPHGRFRVFVVAYAQHAQLQGVRPLSGLRSGPHARTHLPLLPTPDTGESLTGHGRRGGRVGNGRQSGSSLDQVAHLLPTPTGQDAASSGGPAGQDYRGVSLTDATVRRPLDWGMYVDAITQWEALTRPAPAPTQPSKKGTPQLSPAFSEWMMGLPAGHVTDVPGLSRNDMLKALGNGVVPQQAEAALRFLLNVQAVAA